MSRAAPVPEGGPPYYEVIDAEYADDAFPPTPFTVCAKYVGSDRWAMDEELSLIHISEPTRPY